MNIKADSLLTYLKGNWSLQNNLYINKKKKQYKIQQKISLSNILSEINIDFTRNKNNVVNDCFYESNLYSLSINQETINILPLNTYKRYYVSLKNISPNLFHINYVSKDNKSCYEEKLYIINKNIMISTTLIKNMKNERNIGIKVVSYVRSIKF
uniref:Chromophore lyase cpcS/cpeS n=1 Tax=Polysiphonia scopulorum TaxID=257860 RepID=A0A1Z1MIK2_9FLOR|nr:hypothetical protein [Polysiphonia scopulorum]ARW65574.1 hypothetical protein [Polysiphonia scopulorum]